MDFYEIVRKRRSCRAFKSDPVPREVLERVVEAALWAPSGKNRQNFRIFVVTGEKKDALTAIADRSFPFLEPSLRELYDEKVVNFTRNFFRNLGGAPAVLAFYSEPTAEGPIVDTQTVAAAVENALLAAAGEGLQGCWMTAPVRLAPEVDAVLGIAGKEKLNLIAVVPMGYPSREVPTPPRKPGRVTWIGF